MLTKKYKIIIIKLRSKKQKDKEMINVINNKIIFSTIIVFLIANICLSCYNMSLAANSIDTDILSINFTDQFDPKQSGGEKLSRPFTALIVLIVNRILGILQVIGAIILVISLALYGFKGILGSGDGIAKELGLFIGKSTNEYGNEVSGVQSIDKKSLSNTIRKMSIGSVILFGSATIVKIVFKMISGL